MSSLALVAQELELGGGSYQIDDADSTDFWTLALPWHSTTDMYFGPRGPRVYLEGAVSYLEVKQGRSDVYGGAFPGLETSTDTRWRNYGLLFGVGVELALAEELTLTPIGHLGLSRIENDTRYGGPGAAVTAAIADGIAYNWDAMGVLSGGALRLDWRRRLGESYRLEVMGRYDIRFTETFDKDDVAQDFNDRAQLAMVRADLTGPTGATMFGSPLDWQGTVAYRHFLEGDLFDVEHYLTVGGSLLLQSGERFGTGKGTGLNAYASFGDDLFGWSVGISIYF